MAYLIFIFIIFSAVAAFDAIQVGWPTALSLLGSSILSAFAGSGLRGSLYSGPGPIIAGLSMAVIFMVIAQWLGRMYSVGLFENQFSGEAWSLFGFIIGFVCTSKKFSPGKNY